MTKRRFGRIRKLPSGRYQARYLGPDGADHPAPNTFATKRDAERWLSVAESDILRGKWVDPTAGGLTVREWGERWFAAARAHLKVKTQANYRGLLLVRIYPTFGDLKLSAVRPIMVGEWVAELSVSLSPSRVRQAYRLLSQLMRAAVENDLIGVSPCRGVRLPRLPESEPHVLSEEEAARLIAELPAPHDLLGMLLTYAGLRIGEAFALRRRSIDLKGAAVVVSENLVEIGGRLSFDTPKNHQKRRVTAPAFVVKRLRAHLDTLGAEPDTLLFTPSTGGPFHYNAWRTTYFDPAVTAAKLDDVTPHDLRASHASWVAERHGVMAAARRLGHSHGSVTTRHYARAIDARDVEVADEFDRQHGEQRPSPAGTSADDAKKRDDDPARRSQRDHAEKQEKDNH